MRQVIISGPRDSQGVRSLLAAAHATFCPDKVTPAHAAVGCGLGLLFGEASHLSLPYEPVIDPNPQASMKPARGSFRLRVIALVGQVHIVPVGQSDGLGGL